MIANRSHGGAQKESVGISRRRRLEGGCHGWGKNTRNLAAYYKVGKFALTPILTSKKGKSGAGKKIGSNQE